MAPIFFVTNREFEKDRYTHNMASQLAFGRFQMDERDGKLRAGHFRRWRDIHHFNQNIRAGGYDNLFLFLHGYNNTFNSAARAFYTFAEKFRQQDTHQTCFILLSWPSHGQVQQYLNDKTVARNSVCFADTILYLRDCFELNRTHIMAHCMGAYMLFRCLRHLNKISKPDDNTLGEVIWVAGDVKKYSIQRRYFKDKFFRLFSAPTTSYYCEEDQTLSSKSSSSQDLGLGFCNITAQDDQRHHLMDNVRVPMHVAAEEDENCHTYFTANVVVGSICRKMEIKQRAEIRDAGSVAFAEMTAMAEGKNELEVIEMMNRGKIFTNMWSDIYQHFQQEGCIVKRIYVKPILSHEEVALRHQQQMIQQQRTIIISEQLLPTLETLAKAEQRGNKMLAERLRENRENTLLTRDEIGYFLNATNMARNSRLLLSLANAEDFYESKRSLIEMETYIEERVSLVDRLEIKYNIDMVKHGQFPPYEKHCEQCAICRLPVIELLNEYKVELKGNTSWAQMNLSTRGLLYFSNTIFSDFLRKNNLEDVEAIALMRENHLNNIVDN